MTLIETIRDQILSDYEDDSERLENQYKSATPEQKKLLDDAFICVCGYSLESLIRMAS